MIAVSENGEVRAVFWPKHYNKIDAKAKFNIMVTDVEIIQHLTKEDISFEKMCIENEDLN